MTLEDIYRYFHGRLKFRSAHRPSIDRPLMHRLLYCTCTVGGGPVRTGTVLVAGGHVLSTYVRVLYSCIANEVVLSTRVPE